jgi:hypothetical protein
VDKDQDSPALVERGREGPSRKVKFLLSVLLTILIESFLGGSSGEAVGLADRTKGLNDGPGNSSL